MRRAVRLTGLGAGFCAAVPVTLVVAAAASAPALLFVTSLLAGLVGAALVVVVLVPVRADVQRYAEPELLSARAHGRVRVVLRSAGPLALVGVDWADAVPPGLAASPRGTLPRLAPRRRTELGYALTARRRGRYALGPLTLTVRDPFDLARRTVTVGGRTDVVVLPQVVGLRAEAGAGVPTAGERRIAPHSHGHGTDDVVARRYVDGDAVRRLHWKATARRGELMVRQEEEPDDVRALVLLDVAAVRYAAGGGERSEALEWAVVAAASIVAELREAGAVVDLRTSDGAIDRRVGPEHAALGDALLDLAVLEPGRSAVTESADAPAGVVAVLGDLDTDAARRWVAAVPRPASALIGAASDAGARAVLEDAGWTWTPYRPGDAHAAAWAAVVTGPGGGRG